MTTAISCKAPRKDPITHHGVSIDTMTPPDLYSISINIFQYFVGSGRGGGVH